MLSRKIPGLLVSLAILLIAGAAAGGVVTVPGDYALIYDAVQACPAGDTVLVAAGTYTDCTHETEGPGSTPACVIMKTGVTLRGAGKDATIIDAGGLGRGIFVEYVTDVRIENLQVRNAFAEVYGAGILLRHVDATVEMNDLKIFETGDGGIICINEASPVMRRVDFIGNYAKQGGGLALEENSHAQVTDCYFYDNSAPSGGAIFIRQNSNATLTGCELDANFVDSPYTAGGGLTVNASSPTISDCVFTNNVTQGTGGGVAFINGAGGVMEDCVLSGNDAAFANYGGGGGISVESSTPIIRRCLIVENTSSGYSTDGGGMYLLFASPTIENCTIAYNSTSATGTAGGIACLYSGTPIIDKCIIANSTVGAGITCGGATPTISCTDVWGNAGGDALCGTDGGGNFSLDPMFCLNAEVPYNLQNASPCAPGNHPAGAGTCDDALIGSNPVGCGTGIADTTPQPARLVGNAPNPFNPNTRIFFVLDSAGFASLRVYDIGGRLVRILHDGHLGAGEHVISWDGRDQGGRAASSGVYFYELEALGINQARQMILVK